MNTKADYSRVRGLRPWQRELLLYLWDDSKEKYPVDTRVKKSGIPPLKSPLRMDKSEERIGLNYLRGLSHEDRQILILCNISDYFRNAERNIESEESDVNSFADFLHYFPRMKECKIRYGWSGEFISQKFGISYKRMYKLFQKLSSGLNP